MTRKISAKGNLHTTTILNVTFVLEEFSQPENLWRDLFGATSVAPLIKA